MGSSRWGDAALNTALVIGGLVLLVLLYGLGIRAFTPRTTPVRTDQAFARVQVEVLNAAGVDGMAAQATALLRRRGFDVVSVGNAPPRDTSAVFVRSGTALDARHVAQALGLGDAAVVTGGPTLDYSLDVTVALGADYASTAPASP
ncbi:LytR C-terminal domain-containing protein [Rubrivirga sp.]|uniref:LytR C-terminal domain-containing protein n=1 Tax=Rubrivirga sp. TaxID=1885344 RepID=UPI003C770C53